MSAELWDKTNNIKNDLLNAKYHLDSVTELLNNNLKVNDILIEKNNIDILYGSINNMLNIIGNDSFSSLSAVGAESNTVSNFSSNAASNTVSN